MKERMRNQLRMFLNIRLEAVHLAKQLMCFKINIFKNLTSFPALKREKVVVYVQNHGSKIIIHKQIRLLNSKNNVNGVPWPPSERE
jgi:hypothetical protein